MKAKQAETTIRRTEITIETVSVTRIRRSFVTEPTEKDEPARQASHLLNEGSNEQGKQENEQ